MGFVAKGAIFILPRVLLGVINIALFDNTLRIDSILKFRAENNGLKEEIIELNIN